MPIIRIEDPDVFVGLALIKAQAEIKDHGYDSRVVWADGRSLHTEKADYDPLRISLHVKDGKVVKALRG
jgi:hypothetical protein